MTSTATAYPLAWPPGWPRTLTREKGQFRTTMASALAALQDEVRRLGGRNLLLSSNVSLGSERPLDPGVVAYFQRGEQQVAIPCDRWSLVEHNVKAIANTIESMRAIERWGAKHMVSAMFTGLAALPAPGADWRQQLGNCTTLAEAEMAFRACMKVAHPDAGGSQEQAAALNAAMQEARKVLR